MKTNVEIQYAFQNITSDEIERLVKEDLKEKNIKISSISQLNIYYKLDEHAIYYVAELKNKKIIGTGNTPIYVYS
jgi:hypothetical protein